MTPQSLFLLGPTASGKSALALALAREWGGVVCNLDAFQVYRGLDIGTGKPSAEERSGLPHELFDLAGPCDPFSVADFLTHAGEVLERHGPSGRPLIWAGGTGLYYRALRSGLTGAPATDPAILRELELSPPAELQEEIRRVDPEWAATADLANPRRILRALAVFRQTGRPLSAWHRDPVTALVPEARAVLLQQPADALRDRIRLRVETMWDQGWPEEVRGLMELPDWPGCSASRAIGYSEVAEWCLRGGDAGAVRQQIALRTWQYARRQLTWFRRETKLEVIEIDDRSDLSLSHLGRALAAP